jgi:hypothetical protein
MINEEKKETKINKDSFDSKKESWFFKPLDFLIYSFSKPSSSNQLKQNFKKIR